jgi:hypothetical protein
MKSYAPNFAHTFITEFWFDINLDPAEFKTTFEAKFPGGHAEEIETVEPARQGYRLYHLHMPRDRAMELNPFLDEYAAIHEATSERAPSTSYPFNKQA